MNNLFNTVSALAIMIGMRRYKRRHAATAREIIVATDSGYYYHEDPLV